MDKKGNKSLLLFLKSVKVPMCDILYPQPISMFFESPTNYADIGKILIRGERNGNYKRT